MSQQKTQLTGLSLQVTARTTTAFLLTGQLHWVGKPGVVSWPPRQVNEHTGMTGVGSITQKISSNILVGCSKCDIQHSSSGAPYLMRCRFALTNCGVAYFFVIILSRVGVEIGLLLMGHSEFPFSCLNQGGDTLSEACTMLSKQHNLLNPRKGKTQDVQCTGGGCSDSFAYQTFFNR